MEVQKGRSGWKLSICAVALASLTGATGCQNAVGGQVLPSPDQTHDVQISRRGPSSNCRVRRRPKAYAAEKEQEGQ